MLIQGSFLSSLLNLLPQKGMVKMDLKPCPFCGSKVTVENISPKDADEKMYMFECTNDNCASATCFGDYNTDRATAIKNWNKHVAQCITNAKIGTCTINIDLR